MKAIRILAVLAIVALVAAPVATVYAGDKDKATTSGKKNEKVVTVVSVDPDAKTITVKELGGSGYGTGSSTTPSQPSQPNQPSTPGGSTGSATATGNEKTLKVTGSAVSKLNQIRPGQQITVVFADQTAMDTISDLRFDTASGSTATPPSN